MNTSSFFGFGSEEPPVSGGGDFSRCGESAGFLGAGEGLGGGFSEGDRVEDRRRVVARRILDWMGAWPHLRARWHRVVSGLRLDAGEGVPGDMDALLREVADFRMQFPFGMGPERAATALLMQDRVSVLYSELVDLRLLLAHRGTA